MDAPAIAQLKKERTAAKRGITKKINAINKLMDEESVDVDSIQSKVEELKNALERFERAHEAYAPHKQTDDAPNYVTGIRDNVTVCIQRAGQLIDGAVGNKPPSKSVSRTSMRSTASQREMAELKKAAMQAKAETLKYKQELEVAQLRLKQQEDKTAMAVEAAKNDGRLDTLRELEDNDDVDIESGLSVNSNHGNRDFPVDILETSPLRPEAPVWGNEAANRPKPGTEDRTLLTVIEENQCQQRRLLTMLQLPRPELEKFEGNVLDFWSFMRTFDEMYDNENVSDRSKLVALLNSCTGRAHKLIKCCMAMEPRKGYERAKQLLHERFGNEFDIVQHWVSKVTSGPGIKNNDGKGLRDFADSLQECFEIMNASDKLREINSQSHLLKIVNKLPFYLQSRWRSQVRKIKVKHQRAPSYLDLVQFVSQASDEACDPIFGVHNSFEATASKKEGDKGEKMKKKNQAGVYNIEAGKKEGDQGASAPSCKRCQGNHWLHKCKEFLAMTPGERFKFTRKKLLCDVCFRPNHRGATCTKKYVCPCGKKHNKLLHIDGSDNEGTEGDPSGKERTEVKGADAATQVSASHAACTGAGSHRIVLPIVPVKVMTTGGRKSLHTYALLDTGSSGTFCSASLAKSLGISGKREKLSISTLTSQQNEIEVESIKLKICDVSGKGEHIILPRVYVKPQMRIGGGCIAKQEDLARFPHLHDIQLPDLPLDENSVQLLIGQDMSQVLVPEEVRKGKPGDPYATKTAVGWALNGSLDPCEGNTGVTVNFAQVQGLESQLRKFWEIENVEEAYSDSKGFSIDDNRVISTWDKTVDKVNGHYQLPIPFKSEDPKLPVNTEVAKKRLSSLRRRLLKDEQLHEMYTKEMSSLLSKGYAEEVRECDLNREDGKVWYLPHHPVFHPRKPGKVRVVFDCAAAKDNISLNSEVLQGPDLTNSLVGVLLRFREHEVIIKGDVEAMFMQIKVAPDDRDVLRFMWWPAGDLSREPKVYRMSSMVFGGIWSPASANYCLKRAAHDESMNFDSAVIEAVERDFYVDDLLKSVHGEAQAIKLRQDLSDVLIRGGFKLTKWVSNSKPVLETIPESERSAQAQEIDLSSDTLPADTALGMFWDVEADTLGYRVADRAKPVTRRGILSVVSAVYDPLGLVSPFVLKAKQILQELTRLKVGWDETIPIHLQNQWQEWSNDLSQLQNMKIPRCVCMSTDAVRYELHHFSDASMSAFGVCSYLRIVDENQHVACSLLFAKARLAPIKQMTIPRLELTAAALATKVDILLRKELSLPLQPSQYWTDSTCVLSYLSNDHKRFNVFVANRVAKIRQQSDPDQWKFVNTQVNPSDICSRGVNASELLKCETWLKGPDFLYQPKCAWPEQPVLCPLSSSDPEVKKEFQAYSTSSEPKFMERLINRHSSWFKLKKSVAWLLRFKGVLRNKVLSRQNANRQKSACAGPISVSELREAEKEVVKFVQRENYRADIDSLRKGTQVPTASSLRKLDPILIDGVICVGGRLRNVNPNVGIARHPIILPKTHHVVTLIIREYHENAGHVGIGQVLAMSREKFWIIHGRKSVRKTLNECFSCKKRHAGPGKAKMGDLPRDRVNPGDPPFTHVGIDFFGPFHVKRGRTSAKRYGCLFTCLTSRAVHLEVASSLETDSFINAFVRFTSRRGCPVSCRCDNGTNFVGAQRELRENVRAWNRRQIEEFMLKKEIIWRTSPPYASNFGGVWERMIRSVRRVLGGLLANRVLEEESLHTLLCQTEGIINSRPLTQVSDDINDLEAITPNHLLLLRSNSGLPLGLMTDNDLYSRKRWRQVQWLADEFWRRWSKEYVANLQVRSKWTRENPRKFEKGNLVLVTSDLRPRSQWSLGRVIECSPGDDGITRVVRVKTAQGEMTRPISKLCLLE